MQMTFFTHNNNRHLQVLWVTVGIIFYRLSLTCTYRVSHPFNFLLIVLFFSIYVGLEWRRLLSPTDVYMKYCSRLYMCGLQCNTKQTSHYRKEIDSLIWFVLVFVIRVYLWEDLITVTVSHQTSINQLQPNVYRTHTWQVLFLNVLICRHSFIEPTSIPWRGGTGRNFPILPCSQ